jgi:D-3-phosphoglycerate dehydrogenase / 2-oxoglutarate reductase
LNLDQDPPAAVLETISRHPQIKSVTIVKLPAAGEMPVWFG